MTYRDIITQALRSLGVIHTGETPSAQEAIDGLDALNQMLVSWVFEGIDLLHIVEADLNADFPYPADHEGPIRWNLAVRLAAEFGIPLSAEVGGLAGQGFAQLQRYYHNVKDLEVDVALNPYYNANRSIYN